ncbi:MULTISPECIES: hypothetical protein [unclassified Streptomyces]|uniref:hypothetical protein n=1 Tax=unclassified Streptomyces TaxID=2593676 RepID=UPI0037FD9379
MPTVDGQDASGTGRPGAGLAPAPPRLPPGPARTLNRRLHALYRAAGTPSEAALAATAQTMQTMQTAPDAQTAAPPVLTGLDIDRLLGSPGGAGTLRETLALASALAVLAGEDPDGVVDGVRGLWQRAAVEQAAGLRTAERWDPVALGVHPAPGPDGAADLPLTEYLRRPHDEALRHRLAHAAAADRGVFVVLVGRSASGKTRAAYEAVRAALPEWPVLVPADAVQLTTWVEEDGVDARTVLWLNESQRYLTGSAGETAARALGRLLERVAPLAVVGTLWPEHVRRLTGGGQSGGDDNFQARTLLTSPHATIGVPDTLPAHLPETARAAARDPRLAAAVRAAGSGRRVLQHLTTGPELVRRWEDGPDHWYSAAEHAVLTAAVEARRLGHTSAVPPQFLEGAATAFMDSTTRATVGDDWFEAAIGSLTATEAGPPGLIADRLGPGVGNPDGYRPNDYLEQHVRRVRAHLAPPAGFWAAGRWARTGDDAHALGRAAEDRRRYADALALFEQAVAAGSPRARASWAVLLETTGYPADAEETAGTDAQAWAAVAVARENAGNGPGARAAYERTAALGDVWAWAALARMRQAAGEAEDAEAVAEEAAAAGHTLVWQALGRMRADEPAVAERAFRRVVETGDPWGWLDLARLAERAGHLPAAAEHTARAAAAGVIPAWAELVRLHWALGDRCAAERAAVGGAAAGAAEGWSVLARLRVRAGDPAGAEAAYRAAADRGSGAARRDLALLADARGDSRTAEEVAASAALRGDADAWAALAEARTRRGEDDGAERAAGEAARAGDVEAWLALARARQAAEDGTGAERAADLAADHGSPAAWSALARIRERAGDRDGSVRAVERAVSLGAPEAWTALGRVREEAGDRMAAEDAYRRGTATGDADAYALLGALYRETGRLTEARDALRTAVDAGHRDAWEGLLAVLRLLSPVGSAAQRAEALRTTGFTADAPLST